MCFHFSVLDPIEVDTDADHAVLKSTLRGIRRHGDIAYAYAEATTVYDDDDEEEEEEDADEYDDDDDENDFAQVDDAELFML